MSLARLVAAAEQLKDEINRQRKLGAIADKDAEYMMSLTANVYHTLNFLNGTAEKRPALPIGMTWAEGPLSDYIDFPTARFGCPKCGDTRPGRRYYSPEGREGPEHIRHVCFCGYAVRTKPADATPDPFAHDTEPQGVTHVR